MLCVVDLVNFFGCFLFFNFYFSLLLFLFQSFFHHYIPFPNGSYIILILVIFILLFFSSFFLSYKYYLFLISSKPFPSWNRLHPTSTMYPMRLTLRTLRCPCCCGVAPGLLCRAAIQRAAAALRFLGLW